MTRIWSCVQPPCSLESPKDQATPTPVQSVESYEQAVLRPVGTPKLVVCGRCLLLPVGIEILLVGELAVTKSVESWNGFIPRVVVAEVQLFQILPTFGA